MINIPRVFLSNPCGGTLERRSIGGNECIHECHDARCGRRAGGRHLDSGSGPECPGTHQDNSGLNGSLSHGDLQKLSGEDRLQGERRKVGGCGHQPTEVGRQRSGDAGLLSRLQRRHGIRARNAGIRSAHAISCLSAEEARLADVATGKETSFICKLPANKDVNGMVASMIAADAGAPCEVTPMK